MPSSKLKLKTSFQNYPDLKILFNGIKSVNTNAIVNRLKDWKINLQTCNSLIEELQEKVQIKPFNNYVGLFTVLASSIMVAFAISSQSNLGKFLYSLINVVILFFFALWLQYKVLPSHDNKNFLKALRIYQRYLMMGNKNS